jgi:cytochrome oxidase Cu insertion factor (SCO1/SenC/PrrC family)
MRPLVCLAHVLFGLAFTMQGCGRDQSAPAPGKTASLDARVGRLAPEIEGEDIDGVPFKLSDYRGKVVLIDFWGHW